MIKTRCIWSCPEVMTFCRMIKMFENVVTEFSFISGKMNLFEGKKDLFRHLTQFLIMKITLHNSSNYIKCEWNFKKCLLFLTARNVVGAIYWICQCTVNQLERLNTCYSITSSENDIFIFPLGNFALTFRRLTLCKINVREHYYFSLYTKLI